MARDLRRRLKAMEEMRKPATTVVLRFDDYDDLAAQVQALPPHVAQYIALPNKLTEEQWVASCAPEAVERDREAYARTHGLVYGGGQFLLETGGIAQHGEC
jgi:hypothetical protein